MNDKKQSFNFFLFQRQFFFSFFSATRLIKASQTNIFFNKLKFALLKQMSLSSFWISKVKIKKLSSFLVKWEHGRVSNDLIQAQHFFNAKNANRFSSGYKQKKQHVLLNKKKINYFLAVQKQKHAFLFFFQFLKKLKKYNSFETLKFKKNIQLYKNYSGGFFLPDFLEKTLGKIKKNKIFTVREQVYELIKDAQRKRNRIAKSMLMSNNVKFLKKKNWRLPVVLASYIPSKYKKKASNYIYWFNRVFFEKFLKRVRAMSAKTQEKFRFLRNFQVVVKKDKKSSKIFKKFPWKIFYLKNKILFQKFKKGLAASFIKNKKNFFLRFIKSKTKKNKKNSGLNKAKRFKSSVSVLKPSLNFCHDSFFVFNFAQMHVFNFFDFMGKNNKLQTFTNFNFIKRIKIVRKKIKNFKQFLVLLKKKPTKSMLSLLQSNRKKLDLYNLNTLLFSFLKKKKTKIFAGKRKPMHVLFKRLHKKMFFFFKKAKSFMKRYYKHFFDFYPNESYSFVEKNLGKFQLTLNQKMKFLNSTTISSNFDVLQQNFVFPQKNQFLDDAFSSFFLSCYNFFDLAQFDKKEAYNFTSLQKNITLFGLLKKKRDNRVLKARLQHFKIKKQQQSVVPGKIVFTLNSNTIFLTIADSTGVTLLQTSTGSVSKILKVNKVRKEAKLGCGFRRRRMVRQIKISRMIKDFSKGKTKKLKKKFMAQMSRRQKGKRRSKTQSKIKYISQDFVKPLFFLLETFLFRTRNSLSRKQLLKTEKVKLKLKSKLFKLKKANKMKTKTYKDVKKKINEMQKFNTSKIKQKNLTLKQKNIIKFLLSLRKKLVKKKMRGSFLAKLIEKLRFNEKLEKNRNLSLALKKRIIKMASLKKIYSNSILKTRLKKTNFETCVKNVYLRNLKKKYFMLKQNKQQFFDLILFNKEKEKKTQKTFFERLKDLKYSQNFFSSYILCLKNFSVVTIRRAFIYVLKTLLRKTKLLKKKFEKKVNRYVNLLYLEKLRTNNAF